MCERPGDARIDHAVVGAPNNFLLTLTGALETLIFFGTYVVTAAGAGALLEMLTGFRGAHIWGAFLFCAVISFITIRGIKGLVHLVFGSRSDTRFHGIYRQRGNRDKKSGRI